MWPTQMLLTPEKLAWSAFLKFLRISADHVKTSSGKEVEVEVFFPKRGNIREAVGMWLQHSKVGLTWETPNMGTAQLLLLWILRFCTSEAEEWLSTCAVRRDLHCILRWWKKGEMCCSYETALTFLLMSLLFFRAAGLWARWPAGDRSGWRQHGCYWMSPPRKPAQGSGSLQRQTGVAGNIQR